MSGPVLADPSGLLPEPGLDIAPYAFFGPWRGERPERLAIRLETDARAWEIGVSHGALHRFGIDAAGRDACC